MGSRHVSITNVMRPHTPSTVHIQGAPNPLYTKQQESERADYQAYYLASFLSLQLGYDPQLESGTLFEFMEE